MTRKLSLLFVLALFAMSLSSMALAATAKTVTQSKSFISDATAPAERVFTDDAGSSAATSSKLPAAPPTSLGYYMASDVVLGSTEFDWQSNDKQQRQVVMGTDGRIHAVWIYREYGQDPIGPRSVFYNGFKPGVTDPISPWYISPVPGNGGYGSISIGPGDTLALAAYHYTKQGTGYDARPRTAIGRQGGLFSTAFQMYDYPSSDTVMPKILNCQGIKTGLDTLEGGYIWPVIAGDLNGSGQVIAHVLARETAPTYGPDQEAVDTTGKSSLVYFQTPAWAAAPTSTCGYLIDSIASSIDYDIAASPVSNNVAAVYQFPKSWTGYDLGDNDDIVLRVSTDLGTTWGSRQTAVNFGSEDSTASGGKVYYMRAAEVSALYDDNDCLHILYKAYWTDGVTHYYLIYPARLYHYSACPTPCSVMLNDGNGTWGPAEGRPPLGQNLLAKISLTQCTVGGNKRLYAVYTIYPDSTGLTGNTYSDRSAVPVLNGEIVVQGSTNLSGELWGPPVNVSQTRSDGCPAGSCFSEQFTSAAPYTNDSLRIHYLLDKDAGSAIQSAAGGSSNPQGVLTENPIIVKSYPCYTVDPVAILAVSPTSILYPFHTIPGGTNHVDLTLTNTGNTAAIYTRSVEYTPTTGGTWLSFVNSDNSSVSAGCTQTQDETVTATGPATEGLYRATITWSYTGGKTLDLDVELYNFTSAHWMVEQNNKIQTSWVRSVVNQTSRVGAQVEGFKYLSDLGDTAYLYDAGIFVGTSNSTISMGIFTDSAGISGHGDTAIGRLFCVTTQTIDSTGTYPNGYRHAYGSGCNKDSTIGIDADFYAPRHIDSANFIIGKFSLYAGPKNPSTTISNVTVCYAADWDVPDDSADNTGGVDTDQQMVYQQGVWGTNTTRYGAMSGWRDDGVALAGGMVMANVKTIYRLRGYVHDSIWTKIQNTSTFVANQMNYGTTTFDTTADLNSMLIFSKNATITPKATGTFTFYVIFAGQPGPRETSYTGSLVNLKKEICKGRMFIKDYLNPAFVTCPTCNNCGDADGNNTINISDAVFLIAYIFAHGTAPGDCVYALGKGDADGNGTVNISDAVYLIAYIFAHGSTPHCQGM